MINKIVKYFFQCWLHHPAIQFSTFFITIASYIIVILILWIFLNLQNILRIGQQDLQLTVYLKHNISQQQISQLTSDLSAYPQVAKVLFIHNQDKYFFNRLTKLQA